MAKKSKAAAGICSWCFAIETYCLVMDVVKPKLKHLADAKERVAAEEAKVAAARTELAAVQAKVRGLQASGGLGEAERELVGRFHDSTEASMGQGGS